LLVVFAGGPIVYGVQREMEPSSWCICCTQNQQKGIRAKKVTALPNKEVCFYKKFSMIEQLIAYF
jgi:hypothetical protein